MIDRRSWLLAIWLVPVATAQVEVRNSEVWLTRNGEDKQLTRDGRAKLQAELSPGGNRIAYYEQCPQSEGCRPSLVILDPTGRRITSLPPGDPNQCPSILSIAWTGANSVAVECHINPSLNQYLEVDITNGRRLRDLLGYNFTRSPDGRTVAHVGWIVHFAPPYAQSNYLQFDRIIVYPLPKGVKPVEQKGLTGPPEVVRNSGLTYSGIHDFQPGFAWSPDSRHIAFIDCTYDWTVKAMGALDADGQESNRSCSVAVVAPDGEFTLNPLASVTRQAQLSWNGPHQLTLEANGKRQTFTVR